MQETKFGNNPSKHFHMSPEYEHHSESQQTIGKTVKPPFGGFYNLI